MGDLGVCSFRPNPFFDGPDLAANFVLGQLQRLGVARCARSASRANDLLGGVVVLTGQGGLVEMTGDGKKSIDRVRVTAIPYYAWAHRGKSEMAVWMPTSGEGTVK